MKTIKKNELFENLGEFLKSKGINLNEGSYTTRIQKSCDLLTDVINTTQETVKETKVHVDEALNQLRQSIHERTAPKQSSATRPATSADSTSAKSKTKPVSKSTSPRSTAQKHRRQK